MNHSKTLKITTLLVLCSFYFMTAKTQPTPSNADKGWAGLPNILAEIKLPEFPNKDFSILNYGAKGDGTTDCTVAFKNAIQACNQAGGGRVVVPEGNFLTGAIHLKSNVNLYVSDKATIKLSRVPLPVIAIFS